MLFRKKTEIKPETILQTLSKITEPSTGKDLVALGAIESLKTHSNGNVEFKLKLPESGLKHSEQIKTVARNTLLKVTGIKEVQIHAPAKPHASPVGSRLQIPGVKHLIAIASGKGGVGKSTASINLAVALAKRGHQVGLLDADIYGPSIPLMMGLSGRPQTQSAKLIPLEKEGIKVMSIGFVSDTSKPVIWRGPMVHGALTQFLTQVNWGELDYLLVDMPPGTGDAQLTMGQTAPLSGAVIVTTPQEVSLIDARKGLLMFQNLNVPVLGIIENMAGFVSPETGQVHNIFRQGGGKKLAEELEASLLGSLPLDPQVAEGGDLGTPVVGSHPESTVTKEFFRIADQIHAALNGSQKNMGEEFQPLSLEWQS